MKFQYKRLAGLDQVAEQLVRAKPTDAGADVKSNTKMVIPAKGSAIVPTGISVNIPENVMCMVRGRSGLGFKKDVVSFEGTGDPYFCGHLQVKLFNHSNEDYQIEIGDRIGQVVMVPILVGQFEEVEELETEKIIRESNEVHFRGANGFGSSGK